MFRLAPRRQLLAGPGWPPFTQFGMRQSPRKQLLSGPPPGMEYSFVPYGKNVLSYAQPKEGDSSSNVELVKRKLVTIGYLPASETATSAQAQSYNAETRNAIGQLKAQYKNLIDNQDPEVVDFTTYWLLNQLAYLKTTQNVLLAPTDPRLAAVRPVASGAPPSGAVRPQADLSQTQEQKDTGTGKPPAAKPVTLANPAARPKPMTQPGGGGASATSAAAAVGLTLLAVAILYYWSEQKKRR